MDRACDVFIGTYTEPILFGTGKILEGKGEGIYIYRMDAGTGALTPSGIIGNVRNPSFLTLSANRRFLFAVNELKSPDKQTGGFVSSFCSIKGQRVWSFLGKRSTNGADPCYLTLDRTGKWLITANFMSGSVTVNPVEASGDLRDYSDFRQHSGSSLDPIRQNGPHAHAATVSLDNRFVFVPDLGLDSVVVYELDADRGRLEPRQDLSVIVSPGAGPRHLVFHPEGTSAYLINELNSTITSFQYDIQSGRLTETSVVSTLPPGYTGKNTCAHLEITSCGRFLYGSNRGHDTIAGFRIDGSGGIPVPVGHFPSGGKNPRNFAISPDGKFLLSANQDSDTVVLSTINRDTGELDFTGYYLSVPTPVCIVIV